MDEEETCVLSEIVRQLPLAGHIGIDSLPYQLVKKSLQERFTFNILCVGETGIGKSTLISSLFNLETDTTKNSNHKNSSVTLKTKKYNLKEKDVPLRLTVTETVGYGDQINKENNFEPILNYVDTQFEKYLQEELKIKRNIVGYRDTRIHVCLYFICPGHTLKASDLLCMKRLGEKVNVIPLIAKADTLIKSELQKFKSKIREELEKEKIELYDFQSEDEVAETSEYKIIDNVPFAVVGSTDFVVADGKLTRGRNYPWGTICIDNQDHSDFVKLREMLVELHLEDLKRCTHSKHYENYRIERLIQLGFQDLQSGDEQMSLTELLDRKSEQMRRELRIKEDQMIQAFIERAKKTEQELVDAERKMQEKYGSMQRQYEKEQIALEEEKKLLLKDIDSLNRKKKNLGQTKKNYKTSKVD
ncbi:septin-2 [Caerostris darwini]|uniref:Septin n=2 Tax=Caerostris darwini TaxID=1538125 RepID=A0AAV4VFR7_9ARAC|nr:septin-2 [Caerostris darwini]